MKIQMYSVIFLLVLFSCKKSSNLPDAPSNKEAHEFVNSFQCIDGNCEETERGPYSTISECESYCGENQSVFIDPRDGNEYRTMTFQGKTWFLENLRYTQNIDYIDDVNTWLSMSSSAYTYYGNNTDNKDLYGIIYNGYAVKNLDLCPDGWRVPTNDDYAGNILNINQGLFIPDVMATAGWQLPRIESSNSTGYTGLPGGEINSSGFFSIGSLGSWWMSTEAGNDNYHYVLRFTNNGDNLSYVLSPKYYGHYCRCVKE